MLSRSSKHLQLTPSQLFALLVRGVALFIFLCSTLAFSDLPASAAPTTVDQAKRAVRAWLRSDRRPLGVALGTTPRGVKTFTDRSRKPVFHIVTLKPRGFVIVAGDDLVEPIVGFSGSVQFTNKGTNPLRALVAADMGARVTTVRKRRRTGRAVSESAELSSALDKWNTLLRRPRSAEARVAAARTAFINGPRVDPLIQSRWDQARDSSNIDYLYNYYTPYHYLSGCVATALAQIMRYFEYPTQGVGTGIFTIYINGAQSQGSLRGGDDLGGPHDWSKMPLVPVGSALAPAERLAIGRLMSDAGVAVNMQYAAAMSGAYVSLAAIALRTTFRFRSVKWTFTGNGGSLPAESITKALIPNLNAGRPVFLAIWGGRYGHAVVADGYGYNSGTLYHHINMGWGGADDAWYNLPTVDSTYIGFNVLNELIYNIHPTETGEIVSGRITDELGGPVAGVLVSDQGLSATTNARGIYAITNVPSNTTLNLTPQKDGYGFDTAVVQTGKSEDGLFLGVPGNVVRDFVATKLVQAPVITAHPESITVNQGEAATFSVTVLGSAPLAFQWRRNGVDIPGANLRSYTLTNAQAQDSGARFSLAVWNGYGTVSSAEATLNVNTPPLVTSQPQSVTVVPGQTAVFGVLVSGTAPFTYQWKKNGVDISGAVSSTYSALNSQVTDGGARYSVVVSNLVGSVTSSEAVLNVWSVPVILTQPLAQTVAPTQPVTFSVVAAGTSPFSYQWKKNGINITGATSATLTFNAPQTDNGSAFSVLVTNSVGSTLSAGALLTVQMQTYSIRGKVTRNGVAVAGATINGGLFGSTTTNATGDYVFSGIPLATPYQLTPSAAGLMFTPTQAVGTVTSNVTVNFAATPRTYSISGQILLGGAPVSGVAIDAGALGTATTDGSGRYTVANVPEGVAYRVTPTKEGLSFFPAYSTGNAWSNRTADFSALLP